MKLYISNESIYAGSPDKSIAYAWRCLTTGEVIRGRKTADEVFNNATWELRSWVAGQVIACPDGVERALGRPGATPPVGCYEVTLAAPGNPDYSQFAAIAPGGKARGMTLEEIAASCREYITFFDLGGGNWGLRSGVVSQYVNGKKKKIGYIRYNGRYETVAERKAFEKKMLEKYGPSRDAAAES